MEETDYPVGLIFSYCAFTDPCCAKVKRSSPAILTMIFAVLVSVKRRWLDSMKMCVTFWVRAAGFYGWIVQGMASRLVALPVLVSSLCKAGVLVI